MALDQETAAALVGLTTRRLRQLDGEGEGPARNPDGSYPADQFGKWVRERILSELGVAHDGKAYDYDAERARLTKAQADKTELEVTELRGQLIRVPAVENHWQGMVASMRARLLSLPSKIAAQTAAPEKLQHVQDVAQGLVYDALSAIAGDSIPDEIRDRITAADRDEDDERRPSTAKADDKPVGSKKPAAKRGGQRGAGKVSTGKGTLPKGNTRRGK